MRTKQSSIFTLIALLAILFLAALGLFISRAHAPGTGTHPTTTVAMPPATLPPVSQVPYVRGPKDILSSIYMVSASEGWAVGSSFLGPGQRDTIILHYTGGQWKQVKGVPDNAQLQASSTTLSQIAMVSPTEGWAVGNTETKTTQAPSGIILHYRGGRWTVQQMIAGGYLNSLALPSSSDGWAVGGIVPNAQSFPSQSLLLHYTGQTWTAVQAPGQELLSITMTSHTDGWIIGSTNGQRALGDLLLRYNGDAWSQTSLPPSLSDVSHISPLSPTDVWAVGFAGAAGGARNAQVRFSGGGQTAFVHYDGKTWTGVQTPIAGQQASIDSLYMDAANDGWAVGYVITAPNASKMIYLHYTGGQWTEVTGAGDAQYTLFMLSASEGWAVGDNATILHYSNGAWTFALSDAP